jgi:hypothetical protein
MRRQMLVRMNAAATGGRVRLLADGNEMPMLGLAVCRCLTGARELLVLTEQHWSSPAGGTVTTASAAPAARTDIVPSAS